MATEQIISTQLRLTFQSGYDEVKEEVIYSRKSFNNVNPHAAPEALLVVAEALASLQTLPLETVERADVVEIY